MKTILSTLLIGMTLFSNAQVIIGDAVGTASVKTSVLLDFAPNQNKGIILPYVRTLPTTPTEGTMVLDATDATKARVKFYNGAWIDLSGQDADVTNVLATQPTVAQVPEGDGEKVIIGAASSNANGVLVLESTTKSMVLPTVEDVQNIPNPSPGMMVYINKADAKRLAIFNGSKWSFWKP
jgi:Iap family predicted aminopeptidase